jgi:hypothetical protein
MPRVDALGPPGEARRRTNEAGLSLERHAARGLGVFELVDGVEVAVSQRRIGQRPQMLRRLMFGRVGRQQEQVDMLRHAQFDAGVPARPIQDEHDLLGGTRAHGTGEGVQLCLKDPRIAQRGLASSKRA